MDSRLEAIIIQQTPKEWWGGLTQFPMHPLSFGIEVGDGWARLIYNMCKELAYIAKDNKEFDNFSFSQIKEKYGLLRVYSFGGSQEVDGVIGLAERLSGVICEKCGDFKSSRVRNSHGWYITLCKTCWKGLRNES